MINNNIYQSNNNNTTTSNNNNITGLLLSVFVAPITGNNSNIFQSNSNVSQSNNNVIQNNSVSGGNTYANTGNVVQTTTTNGFTNGNYVSGAPSSSNVVQTNTTGGAPSGSYVTGGAPTGGNVVQSNNVSTIPSVNLGGYMNDVTNPSTFTGGYPAASPYPMGASQYPMSNMLGGPMSNLAGNFMSFLSNLGNLFGNDSGNDSGDDSEDSSDHEHPHHPDNDSNDLANGIASILGNDDNGGNDKDHGKDSGKNHGTGKPIDVSNDSKGEWGDPHFDLKGQDGKALKFDHKGKNGHTYNLFSGSGFNVNGTYDASGDPKAPQKVGKADIQVGDDKVSYNKDGQAELNGKKLKEGSKETLQDGSNLEYKDKKLTLTGPDGQSIDLTNSDGIIVKPKGHFDDAGGIIGTAMANNKNLSSKECEKFDITNN